MSWLGRVPPQLPEKMKALAYFALALILTGCARFSYLESGQHLTESRAMPSNPPPPEDHLRFTYRVEGRNALLDSDKVTFLFPDLSASERGTFFFMDGSFPVQIGGEGIFEGSVSVRRNFTTSSFSSHYENGTATIDFCGRKVLLADRARIAMIDERIVDLSSGKLMVRVDRETN